MSQMPAPTLPRDPEAFDGARLFASDYDGTQFQTFEPGPEGIGVNEAYEGAIGHILGRNALARYHDQGGHHNRTPSEIVESLLIRSDGHFLDKLYGLRMEGATTEEILEFAAKEPRDEFTQGWLATSEDRLRFVSEVVVAAKLEPLVRQVGQKLPDGDYWPRPVEGFLEFSGALEEARQEGLQIDTAVISAGHAGFIAKTYEIHGMPLPDIMVTDETIQARNPHISAERRAKPAPYPLAIAKVEWLKMYNRPAADLRDGAVAGTINERIIYVGDVPDKDGGLAENGHVDFVLIDPQQSAESWQKVRRQLPIGSVAVGGAGS